MKQPKQQNDKKPRRRLIIIGPGIILALIIAIQIVIANRQKPSEPPIIERQVVGSGITQNPMPAPEPGYLLDHKDRLGLSEHQINKLEMLRKEWQVKSEPLSADLRKAAGEFNDFMKEAGDKVTMKDIQSHAGTVSELSRDISSLRRIYWEKAQNILNKEQQSTIREELARNYSPEPFDR